LTPILIELHSLYPTLEEKKDGTHSLVLPGCGLFRPHISKLGEGNYFSAVFQAKTFEYPRPFYAN
jgi:hypothetical protein